RRTRLHAIQNQGDGDRCALHLLDPIHLQSPFNHWGTAAHDQQYDSSHCSVRRLHGQRDRSALIGRHLQCAVTHRQCILDLKHRTDGKHDTNDVFTLNAELLIPGKNFPKPGYHGYRGLAVEAGSLLSEGNAVKSPAPLCWERSVWIGKSLALAISAAFPAKATLSVTLVLVKGEAAAKGARGGCGARRSRE